MGKLHFPESFATIHVIEFQSARDKWKLFGLSSRKTISKGGRFFWHSHLVLERKPPLPTWHANMVSRTEAMKKKKPYAKEGGRGRQKESQIVHMCQSVGQHLFWTSGHVRKVNPIFEPLVHQAFCNSQLEIMLTCPPTQKNKNVLCELTQLLELSLYIRI